MPYLTLSIVFYHSYFFINFSCDHSLCVWLISFLKTLKKNLSPWLLFNSRKPIRERERFPLLQDSSLSKGPLSVEGTPDAFRRKFLPPHSHLLLFPIKYRSTLIHYQVIVLLQVFPYGVNFTWWPQTTNISISNFFAFIVLELSLAHTLILLDASPSCISPVCI